MADKEPRKKRELAGREVKLAESTVPKEGESQPCTITRILETTATEVFGAKVEGDPDREVYVVYFEGEGFVGNNVMTKLASAHPKSNLGRFHKRWGTFPKKGMKASAHMDEDGNYHLDLAN